MIEVAVVDDHPLFGQAISELLQGMGEVNVCFRAESGADCLQKLRHFKPLLLILDLQLKGMSGLELLSTLSKTHPKLLVLVLSMHPEETWGERALRVGAKGYVSKAAEPEQILNAVKQVITGKLAFSQDVVQTLLLNYNSRTDGGEDPVKCLTNRELEVFLYLGQGLTTRKISEMMHLSIKTIETYRERIKQKLSLLNTNQLLKAASLWVARCHGFPDK